MYVNVEHWLRVWRDSVATIPNHMKGWTIPAAHVEVLDFILRTPEAISLITDIFHTGDVQANKDAARTAAIMAVVEKSPRLCVLQPAAALANVPWEEFLNSLPGLVRILLTLNARR